MFEQLTLYDLILKTSVKEGFLSHISLWTLYNAWLFSRVAQQQIPFTFDAWALFAGQDDDEGDKELVAAFLVLPIFGLCGLQGDGLTPPRSIRVPRVGDLLLRHYPVDFCEDVVEGGLHVGGVQGRRLDETQVVLLRERLRLVCRHRA